MKETGSPSGQSNLSVKLSIPRKLCFGLGDTANSFSWNLISSYLMIFYTDVFKIAPYAVSVLFLLARFWDAINDQIGRAHV